MIHYSNSLFLSHIYLDGTSCEIKIASQFILQEPLVRVLDVLWQVTEECKRGALCRELSDELNLDVFAFCSRWRIILNLRKHSLIES